MSEFGLVLIVSSVAALLTWLGAPLAERYEVSPRVVSGALQFAAGILVALVFVSLMPTAVRAGPLVWMALAFFVGGVSFVLFDYLTSQDPADPNEDETTVVSLGLYGGILADLVIDGVVIGIGSTLSLAKGLLLAFTVVLSTFPLAFVTIATARQQGMPHEQRRVLSAAIFLCVLGGAMFGYLFLRNQSETLSLVFVSLAAGFLITTVTQALVPEALKGGKPGLTGLLFVVGLTLYAAITLTISN